MKKLFIVLISCVVLITITTIILSNNRHPLSKIVVRDWRQEEQFVLCEIETNSASGGSQVFHFSPKYKEDFIEEITQNIGYLGNARVHYMGITDAKAYILYYNDCIYAVMKSGEAFTFIPCCSDFSYRDEADVYCSYRYITLNDWAPSNTYEAGTNGEFDEEFGMFEDAYKIYGHLSDEIVLIDEENKIIRAAIYDTYNRVMVENKCVCIDFNKKEVYIEVVEDL